MKIGMDGHNVVDVLRIARTFGVEEIQVNIKPRDDPTTPKILKNRKKALDGEILQYERSSVDP